MSLVLDIGAMFSKQLRQNGLGISIKAGPLYLPSASQFAKLHLKMLPKFVHIAKILILHGCSHDVGINVSVDTSKLTQDHSMRTCTKSGTVIHVNAAARERSVRSPSSLPFAVVVDAVTQGGTASFNYLRKE